MRALRVLLLFTCAAASAGASAASSATPNARQQLQAVLAATPNPEHGAQLFKICASCHGTRGAGDPSGWPPEIAGQHPRVIAKELSDYRAGVRWYDPMERIAGLHVLHTPQDIADAAAYVGSMPAFPQTTTGKGEWLERGARLYKRDCQSCHGTQGQGSNAQFVPRVGGQQYEYLLRQVHDVVDGRRPNMVPHHRWVLRGYVMEDLVGIADYMSRLLLPAEHEAAAAARDNASAADQTTAEKRGATAADDRGTR